jgi:hypothetical protein
MNLSERLETLSDAWRDGVIPLPRLALALDQIVGEIGALDLDAGVRARRSWGQIEIINALLLDGGSDITDAERAEIGDLLSEVRQIVGETGATADS